MRILHITKKYPPLIGGDAIVVQSLEREQKNLGHDVVILTSKTVRNGELPDVHSFGLVGNGYDLDQITVKRILSLVLLFFQSFFLLRKIKPGIIHSHSPDVGFVCSFVARLYGIPIVHTCHGVTFADKQYASAKRMIERFFLRYGLFSTVITVDKTSLQALHDAHITPAVYIPNGVDLDFFTSATVNQKEEICTFLFVGRLEGQKGVMYLIEAVRLLTSFQRNFKVLIVGEGSLSSSLRAQVATDQLENVIIFVGKKDKVQLRAYYQQAHIFVLPSLWEGFPLTILEAWAAGLAVIATKVNGIPAICTDKKDALLVPKEHPQELALAMKTLLDNRELAASLGQQGRTLVSEHFSWQKIIEEILEVYASVRTAGNSNNAGPCTDVERRFDDRYNARCKL